MRVDSFLKFNVKKPKSKVVGSVQIEKYKNGFSKVYAPNSTK